MLQGCEAETCPFVRHRTHVAGQICTLVRAHEADMGSFLGCSGYSYKNSAMLHYCTWSCNENWSHFVFTSWCAYLDQLNFMQFSRGQNIVPTIEPFRKNWHITLQKLTLQHVPSSWLNCTATELAQLPFLDLDGISWLSEQAGMNVIFRVSSQIQGNHLDYRSNETNQRMNLISTWFTFIKVLLERQHIFELENLSLSFPSPLVWIMIAS